MRSLGQSKLLSAISNITASSSLIKVTTATAHNLSTGNKISIEGVAGTTEANGSFRTITVVDATNFTIDGSTFTNTYTSGTGNVYRPQRLRVKQSASLSGGNYVLVTVSYVAVADGNVILSDTIIVKLTNTTAVVIIESAATVDYRIESIDFRNKSTTDAITVSVELELANETLEPMSALLDQGERFSWIAGSLGSHYTADGRSSGMTPLPPL